MTGRGSRQLLPLLPKSPSGRSDGRSQGRPEPARTARTPLTARRSGGYSLLVLSQLANRVRFDGGNSTPIF